MSGAELPARVIEMDVLEKLLPVVRTQLRILLNRFFHFVIGQILSPPNALTSMFAARTFVFDKKGGAACAAPPGIGPFPFSDRDRFLFRDPYPCLCPYSCPDRRPYPYRDDLHHYHRQCSLPFPGPVARRSRGC